MSNCPIMPLAVRSMVFQMLRKSRVEVKVSKNPNGNIDGIHPIYKLVSTLPPKKKNIIRAHDLP